MYIVNAILGHVPLGRDTVTLLGLERLSESVVPVVQLSGDRGVHWARE